MAELSFNIVKLHFKTPLHLSKGKKEYTDVFEILHSDTLKSALFVCAKQIYGKERINKNFFDQFTISSAFPFYEDELFFPKPFIRLPVNISDITQEQENKKNKKLKNLLYVGKSIFEAAINNQQITVSETNFSDDGKFLSENLKPFPKIFEREEQQRVTINWGKDAVPFYTERLHFSDKAGLYFIIQTNEQHLQLMDSSLKLLRDNGIGSYKNLGNGNFDFKILSNSLTLNVHDNANYLINLSLYCPLPEEIKGNTLDNSSYQLVKRGGYIASPEEEKFMSYRKRSVFMFAEGSVFPYHPEMKGKIVNLKPENTDIEHDIWRDGTAIFIPLKQS